MRLNSKQLSAEINVSDRTIRRLTQSAVAQGINVIKVGEVTFRFTKIPGIGGRGWVYCYEALEAPRVAQKPKRKVKPNLLLNPADLPVIADLKRFSVDEKMALINFYTVSGHPLGHIVKMLLLEHRSDMKPASLQARVKRWVKIFKDKGRSGLEDKRGGKAFKSDLDLVEQAILGGGTLHDTTVFSFYCYLYAKEHGLPINLRKPTADVSVSAFNRAVKHLIQVKPLLKDYLHLGMDAFTYAEPSFGRDWHYANQQWEVDATPMDLMVKVPLNKDAKGVRDYALRDVNDETDYQLTRVQIIRVIDNFSKATVVGLYESSNSYANARLLYKAFKTLGMPEIIKGDNGGDYVSEHLQGVIADLGIQYIATGKARGDEKGTIERSFRTLQHSAAFESLPGFVGHNVGQRQHLENESSTKLQKLSGVATNIKADFMWHWEAENWLENYLLHADKEKYAEHGQVSLNETQIFEIYRQLGKKFTRKVSKEGIRHRNRHFLSYEMWDKLVIGDTVQIIENLDDSTIVFLYKDGEYLGQLQDKNIFAQKQTVEDIKASKKVYKQRVVKGVVKVTKQAQKTFKGYQNSMRDEFLEKEIHAQTHQKQEEKETEKTGFDPMAEYTKLALEA